MNDTAFVRVMQRLRAGIDDLDDVIDTQQVIGPTVRRQRACAVDVLHHHVIPAVFLASIIDWQDIRMLQHPDHVRLIEEHLARNPRALRVLIGLDVVDLDRNVATKIRIVRQIDVAGAALPDLINNVVLPDFLGNLSRIRLLSGELDHPGGT